MVQFGTIMPAFKPDSSFFRKIVIGAVGARAVCADLNEHGHTIAELERGSTDTKLWKDVKRKRVRIPDLVCTTCGLRIEGRAKSKPELSMSHSPTETERSWDFGMVETDVVAYPVCGAVNEKYWSTGKLDQGASYWHERNWVKWQAERHINYFSVSALRPVPFVNLARKGVTEGSELMIAWPATFATYDGVVAEIGEARISIQRIADGRTFARAIKTGQQVAVHRGQSVSLHEVIASTVLPLQADALRCPGGLAQDHIVRLLASRERTQRFTGVKLARLRSEASYSEPVTALARDPEEDIYVKLESVSYLSGVCGQPLAQNIQPYLTSPDPQIELESVITLGETATAEAGQILSSILDNQQVPYFLRSAAAWSLARVGGEQPIRRLIRAFADVDSDIRQEALESVVTLSGEAVPFLLASLREAGDNEVSAGAAEALRQCGDNPAIHVDDLIDLLDTAASPWPVWLLGVLPRDRVAAAVVQLQNSHPELHYAITVLWSFVESWIARRWELRPKAEFREND
jgi:HEAT repeat protein